MREILILLYGHNDDTDEGNFGIEEPNVPPRFTDLTLQKIL
jgi:hypothetical protein